LSAALVPSPRSFVEGDYRLDADRDGEAGMDTDLRLVIQNGASAYGGSPSMSPWAFLGDEAIDDLVAYIRTLEEDSDD
jgi:hypothetical protein